MMRHLILPDAGRGTARRVVEGVRLSRRAAPSRRVSPSCPEANPLHRLRRSPSPCRRGAA